EHGEPPEHGRLERDDDQHARHDDGGNNGPECDFSIVQSGWKNSGERRDRIKIKLRYGRHDGPGHRQSEAFKESAADQLRRFSQEPEGRDDRTGRALESGDWPADWNYQGTW